MHTLGDEHKQTLDDEYVELPLMPLREVVMFPHSIIPLFVGREASIKAIEHAVTNYDRKICLVVQREPEVEKPSLESLYPIGVVSRILQFLRLPDGTIKVLFEGLYRVHWEHLDSEKSIESFHKVMVKAVKESTASFLESEALVRATHEALEEYTKNNKKITQEALAAISGLRDPGRLADAIMPHLKVDYIEKQSVLEQLDPVARLEKVYELLSGEITVSTIERRIKSRVKTQMERNHREYYLSEQIKAIQKEMGRDDDPQAELADLEKKLFEKNMPEYAREKGLSELKKLKHMSPSAAEYAVVRNYVDWVYELPWNEVKETEIDISNARQILDRDHYGLEKPKQRILEYLAVQKLTGSCKGTILCLVGPPGVGKTSLARSVAKATEREYVRLSLGGVRDEAEIRGHRRTYVGAMPGKLITALKRVKYNNPLFCLDEIDKMSADFRGDPASALLEVLDPEQNSTFNDHYLDLDYDLSQIFFITTANSLQGIPAPLKDRMEIIELSSYLEVEKKHIVKDFLLPRQVIKHGLKPENIRISENALTEVIRSYTREAGVRNLEREIAALCRKVAIKLVEKNDMDKTISITRQNLGSLLGVKKYRINESEKTPKIGVVNGLAYTSVGGVLLNVESVIMPGKGNVSTTGKLGEVMIESARAALSYVRSRSDMFGLRPDFHSEVDIHIHFPEGATPKDGPSAGIAITTSLVSALLGIPVRHDVAMTGEVTLRGRVLPIGGLREKLLAASRAEVTTVIVPRENEKDLKEVPEEILKALHIQFVEHIDEVLPLALISESEDIFSEIHTDEPFTTSLRRHTVEITTAQ
ncbi:endopeptidase La [Lawsonia intracellularis]|uniref:Lon protease n=1 Tax=Lawsonia intracellularis (strain PHE/MN1-00) TaxID=363253 RepID=Q1MQ77_LAWIP|nr:endopeptidase La [Lawsonia intracellularis]AGC50219.1 ATP-dependent protease La [Lawsonia intracellularis N343]KAA0204646.1 endopeptidase La [Lawsonia intracellularis]MBZ3892660.1 endopeptidase La [Lawsonia intracellularis]RBN33173.1 endopeptidase La [Lawsonia intracellularis]RBN35002.1 endopeptidase La [Lawsonia intracellularis]